MDFTIIRASEADIPRIRSAAQEAFPTTYSGLISREQIEFMMEWMYSQESLKKQFDEGHIYYLAVSPLGDIAGYVSFQREEEKLFHLHKIYVVPRYQGCGLGRRLFEHTILKIKEIQPEKCVVELNVNRGNKALQFYKHLGMHIARQGDYDIGGGYFMNDYSTVALKIIK